MSGSRSLFAGVIVAFAVTVGSPAAAENVLRFMGADATASTMDPHAICQ